MSVRRRLIKLASLAVVVVAGIARERRKPR
jgi:hypothetical protein